MKNYYSFCIVKRNFRRPQIKIYFICIKLIKFFNMQGYLKLWPKKWNDWNDFYWERMYSFPECLNIALVSFICIKNLWNKFADIKIMLHDNAIYTWRSCWHGSRVTSNYSSVGIVPPRLSPRCSFTYSKWKSSRSISSPRFQAFSSLRRHSKRATVSFSPHARWTPGIFPTLRYTILYPGLWQFVSKFQLINGAKKGGRKHSRQREKERNRG